MNAHCTRCVGTRLVSRSRDGIEVDVCPRCRGVWLDRGELEKLLAIAARDGDFRDSDAPPSSSRRGGHSQYGNRRKRGLLATLGDLFD